MTPTPEPRTAAGKALLATAVPEGEGWVENSYDDTLSAILAIEAEAASPATGEGLLDYIAEQVNAAPILKVSGEAMSETLAETTGVVGAEQFFVDWDEQEWFVAQSTVLAVIESARSRLAATTLDPTPTVAAFLRKYDGYFDHRTVELGDLRKFAATTERPAESRLETPNERSA